MSTVDQLHEIAKRLRVRLAECRASHVMVVNGGQAGHWIEAQRDDWYFQISDRDGAWGVTTYTPKPNGAEGTFEHHFEGMGVTVYWLHDRTDGPDGVAASNAEVMTYLITVGVLAGVPSVQKRLARIEASHGDYLGTTAQLTRAMEKTGVAYTLLSQHSFVGGGFGWVVEIMSDHWTTLVDSLRKELARKNLGSVQVMSTDSTWPWADDEPLRYLILRLFDAEDGETAYKMIAELRKSGIPFDHYGPIINRQSGESRVTLILPDAKANTFIRFARDLPNGALYVFGIEP